MSSKPWFSTSSEAIRWMRDEARQWVDDKPEVAAHLFESATMFERAEAALAEAQQSSAEPVARAPCKGKNCGSTDYRFHSVDCFAEHEATVNPGGMYDDPSLAAAVSAAVERCAHTASVFGASGIVTSAIRGLAPTLSAEAETMREDAKRYRIVRERAFVEQLEHNSWYWALNDIEANEGDTTQEQFDTAVDQARKP